MAKAASAPAYPLVNPGPGPARCWPPHRLALRRRSRARQRQPSGARARGPSPLVANLSWLLPQRAGL